MSDPSPGKPIRPANEPTKQSTTLNPKAVAALVIAAVSGIFIFSNLEDQTVHWLFFEFKAPGWILYSLLFLAGGAIGFFLGRNRYRSKG